jgi:hypothetical protein
MRILALYPAQGSKFKNSPYITGFARYPTSVFTNQATLPRFENFRNVEMCTNMIAPGLNSWGKIRAASWKNVRWHFCISVPDPSP